MNHSQIPVPFFLNQDFPLEQKGFIPTGARAFEINDHYLREGSFPREVHDQLLIDAEQARIAEKIYVHCPDHGKCISISPHLLDKPIP